MPRCRACHKGEFPKRRPSREKEQFPSPSPGTDGPVSPAEKTRSTAGPEESARSKCSVKVEAAPDIPSEAALCLGLAAAEGARGSRASAEARCRWNAKAARRRQPLAPSNSPVFQGRFHAVQTPVALCTHMPRRLPQDEGGGELGPPGNCTAHHRQREEVRAARDARRTRKVARGRVDPAEPQWRTRRRGGARRSRAPQPRGDWSSQPSNARIRLYWSLIHTETPLKAIRRVLCLASLECARQRQRVSHGVAPPTAACKGSGADALRATVEGPGMRLNSHG